MIENQSYNLLINSKQKEILDRHLRRIDKMYDSIAFSAEKVLLYTYMDNWCEMGIEGAIYLYKRSGAPSHRLIVFNKKNLNDFKLNIPSDFYLELQEQFVIFSHTDKENIFGFWFEDDLDAKNLYEILTSILKNTKKS